MTTLLKNIAVMLIVASVTVLSGCAATGGSGAEASDVGDLRTERAVARALFSTPELQDDTILVGCVNGVVTLTGQVDSELDRQVAERVASGVSGVSAINNNLTTRS